MHFGGLVGGFFDHVGVMWRSKNRLGGSLRALLRLEGDFLGSTPPSLESFGELMNSVLETCWYLLSL